VVDPGTASGMYSKGNREWHLVVEDAGLAELFARYIEHDRTNARLDADAGFAIAAPALPDLFVPIAGLMDEAESAALAPPRPVAPSRLPADGQPFEVRPLLSPDNYAARVTELIEGAEQRLYLQYSYINWSDRDHDARFRHLLEYLGELSWRDDFDLRVIVGSRDAAENVRELATNGWNEAVVRGQSRIHNKGIVADGKRVLVSSQNWSGDGFLRNRDAGLIVDHPEVASYYEQVFLHDWDQRSRPALREQLTAIVADAGAPTPPGMVRMRWQDYYED
jgi:PLD-like domain